MRHRCSGAALLVYFITVIAVATLLIIVTSLGLSANTMVTLTSTESVKPTIKHATSLTIRHRVSEMSNLINKAIKHVRGSKTSDSILEALDKLNKTMHTFNIRDNFTQTDESSTQTNCSEVNIAGQPSNKGYQILDCNDGNSISNLLTVVIYLKHNNISVMHAFLKSIYQTYSHLSVMVLVKDPDVVSLTMDNFPNVFVHISNNVSEGESLNNIIPKVETPYVLIARNMEIFTIDARLERLVRELDSLKVTVAAGSTVDGDGQWKPGCYQSAYRNYSLVYHEGYDESKHGCMFCDYTDSPFVTSITTVREHKFGDMNDNEGLLEDWFLRLKQSELRTVVCPDSMFYVRRKGRREVTMSKLFSAWDLYRVLTVEGKEVLSECKNLSTFPVKDYPPTIAVPPCALQENINIIKFFIQMCKRDKLICEIEEGTNLGSVKFSKVLPWEYDGDLTYMENNYTAIMKQQPLYVANGYKLLEYYTYYDKHKNIESIGWLFVENKMWLIEMYQRTEMDTLFLTQEGITPTQVFFGDDWVTAPLNPGSFARNRYGREILRHVLHWRRQGEGTNGWAKYKAGTFPSCDDPGHHACFDQYNADGSIQFELLLP